MACPNASEPGLEFRTTVLERAHWTGAPRGPGQWESGVEWLAPRRLYGTCRVRDDTSRIIHRSSEESQTCEGQSQALSFLSVPTRRDTVPDAPRLGVRPCPFVSQSTERLDRALQLNMTRITNQGGAGEFR